MDLFFSGKTYYPINFSNLIQRLRMDFYYFLFDKIEQAELSDRMNKYFGTPNKRITTKDYKWLVNKVRTIHDNKLHQNRNQNNIKELKVWKQYRNGVEVNFDFLRFKSTEKYEVIYTECLDYIKTLYSLQKENLIIKIATLTLIVSLIGILITFLLHYI